MSLAPVLIEVEKSVTRVIGGQGLDSAQMTSIFAHARSFLLESQGMFKEVQETLLTDQEGLQKLELAEQELAHSQESLDRLEQAVLGGKSMVLRERLETFLNSAKRCNEQFSEFAHLASQQQIYSPIPAFDAFIKAGIKVLEEQLAPSIAYDRSLGLMPELGRLERLVGVLPLVHQIEGEQKAALESGLTGLQSGFGALGEYFESGEKPALEDALRLMGSSTTILADQLHRVEALVSQNKVFSSFRPLEEWLLLRRARPDIPVDWVVGTVSDLFASWDFLLARGHQLQLHPLLSGQTVEGGLSAESWPGHLQTRESTGRQFAQVGPEAWMETPDQAWLDLVEPLEKLQGQVMASQYALEVQMGPFRELPGLERIASLKELVKAGQADPSLLEEEFEKQLVRVEELISTVSQASDPVSREFADLLPIHRGAFVGMKENLETGDWEGLEGRWQGVLTTLPHLAALSQAVKARMDAEKASKRVNCLRCGESNEAGRRVCSSCGANLPAVVQKAEQTVELGYDDEGQGQGGGFDMSGRAVEILENLVQGLESNTITREGAGLTLKSMIAEVDANRKVFAARVLPLMGKDETLDAYLRMIAQDLGAYFGGLMQMNEATENGPLSQLHSGLAACQEAQESLESMKSIIDEALRG